MKINSNRAQLLASSLLCGVAFAALSATGAFAADTKAGATEVGEIVVTGSRIPQPNLQSVSPVQVVGSQEISLGGRTETVDFMNQLPQVFQNPASALSSTSNPLSGPGGVATVDLRGLGQSRTLVLVDGRRLGPGDPNTGNPNPSADLNQIPSQLVDRVEVLTGGASATYGSDAIAGVVNFVMKRNFEGVQIDAKFGINEHDQHNDFISSLLPARQIKGPTGHVWDGKAEDFAITMGSNFDDSRGNVTAFFTYHNQDPVVQISRDYAACQLLVNTKGVPSCGGSTSSNLFTRTDGTGGTFAVVGNNFVPWSETGATNPLPRFNSNSFAYLQQGSTRYTAGFFAHYDVNDSFKPYMDFNYMNDQTHVVIAPAGLFQSSALVNCNNPLMSAQQANAIGCTAADIASGANVDLTIGRRNVEGGGRTFLYEHNNYRIVAGAKGDIKEGWAYDAYASYYYTTLYQSGANYVSLARSQEALQVVQTANGPACLSGNADCVPWNIFKDGGVTKEALNYIQLTGTSRGATWEKIGEINITGDLGTYGIKSPWAQDGIGVAFGMQHRETHLEYLADAASGSGDLSGSGGASVPLNNSISVNEAYAETRIPLAQGLPFIDRLSLELGYRYSDYSTGISADTYKAGLEWAPTEDVRFRASYQRAIRAPTLLDLYTPQAVTNTSSVAADPCAPLAGAPATATLAQCLRTGVTAAQYGNGGSTNTLLQCVSGQCTVLNGGNPDLKPETAKTFSVGMVATPRFFPGFIASVDYYHIDLEDGIGTVPLQIILDKCLSTGEAAFCGLIHRAPNGKLWGKDKTEGYISGTNTNVSAGTTSGIDVSASYKVPMDALGLEAWGGVSLNFDGTYLIDQKSVPLPGDPEYDCAGLFGASSCGGINPEWRHTLRINWNAPANVTVSAAWRYISSMTYEKDSGQPTISIPNNTDQFNHELPSRSYLDLSASWRISDTLSVRGGMNNVLDQDPPLIRNGVVQTGLPNTYPNYDLMGRRLFVAMTANF